MSSDDEVNIEDAIGYSVELKTEGNEHFRAKRWEEALAAYRSALGRLPKRAAISPKPAPDVEENLESRIEQVIEPSELEQRCAKARSVLSANIGACFLQLGDHKAAVEACTEALQDDREYVKALQRRAFCNEKLDTWSSLTSAIEDNNALLKLLPSSQTKDIERTISRLKPRAEAAQKKETAEMMGKLKNLGNSLLGNFGLSTDNFKFEPNGQGGYSMNFSQ
ncbi:TPR-like protein [Mycena floridula]|nr:TPR-like protein [Mycena floridula]